MTSMKEETLDFLDFEAEIPCESMMTLLVDEEVVGVLPVHHENIPPADWAVTRVCCTDQRPKVGFFCNACLQNKINHGQTQCPICSKVYIPTSTAWSDVTRIRGDLS